MCEVPLSQHDPLLLARGGGRKEMPDPQVLIASFRARERAALEDLDTIVGGRSLCSLSRQGAPVPSAKHYEGAAAALAEARRAMEAFDDGPEGCRSGREALLDVRDRWRTYSRTRGRTGPDWSAYLAGGLAALEQMMDDDGGLMSSIPETDPLTDSSADLAVPVARRRYASVLDAWPLRRWMAVAVAAPVLFGLMVAVSGGWAPMTPPGWTALVAVAALACATTLASYLPHPGAGLRPDLGCTPCAAVAAVTVLASFGLLSSAPHDVSTAVLAVGASGFGLVQRLNNPSTCPA